MSSLFFEENQTVDSKMESPILLSDPNQLKDFQCPVCRKIFSRKFTLEMHLLIHKGVKPHPCPFCGKCFRQKGTLMRHKALHSVNHLFHCSLCNRGFRQKNVFLYHLRHRHNVATETLDRRKYPTEDYQSIMDTLPSFVLADSRAIASSEKNLDAMLFETLNSGISAAAYSEESFNAKQNNGQALLNQERKNYRDISGTDDFSNSENISYKCSLCFKFFCDYNEYKQHVREQHNNEEFLLDSKPLLCSTFTESNAPNSNHTSSKNISETFSSCDAISNVSNVGNYHCPNVDMVTSSNDKATNEKENFSMPCQKKFLSKKDFEGHLKIHVQSVFKKTWSGNDCNSKQPDLSIDNRRGRKISRKINAKLSFSNMKYPKMRYKCKLCNGTFGKRVLFEYHRQMHINNSAFKCGQCKKRFKCKQLLLSHTRSKHMKSFKCDSCARVFNYPSIFIFHKRNCPKSTEEAPKNKFSFPLINLEKLLGSEVAGIAGVIPICDSGASRPSNFKMGIPIVSVESIRSLSNISFMNSLEIEGLFK